MDIITYVIIALVIVFALLLCFCLAVASFSFENYYEKLRETDQKRNSAGITTFEYVTEINKIHFGGKLQMARCAEFDDHYSTGRVALSEKTMASNSLASLAIVSHELGHARQDATSDKLTKHWRLKKIGRICGLFFMPVMLAGVILSVLNLLSVLEGLVYLILGVSLMAGGLMIFVFACILKYKEIKIEREASDFALVYLQEILMKPEVDACKEFLNSARLTYWASLFRTMFSWTLLTKKESMFR
ncbi:MAG: zinc metallopeptidase [Clostridia bacterium]|nr:zinc metallopeptidase [Clostridia bacterium]